MAALNVTASQVIAPTDGSGVFGTGVAGVNIAAGQSLYLDATTNTIKLADSNASQATAAVIGIATHGALTGQPVKYQGGRTGYITLGASAAPAVGVAYSAGSTAGSIVPISDLTTADYGNILGFGASSNRLQMCVFASGSAIA